MKKFATIALLLSLSFWVSAQNTSAASSEQPAITLKIGGMSIVRYNYSANADPSGMLSLRNARLNAGGRIAGDFEYRLQATLDGTANTVNGPHMLDAYVEWQKYKAFRVKLGQFKRAFTFENPMSPIDQGFSGYGMAVSKLSGMSDRAGEHSSGGRDLGIQVQGDLFELEGRTLLHYMAGIYNGQGINVPDLNGAKDVIGSLWVSPARYLRIGVSGWLGRYGRRYEGAYAEVDRNRYAISADYTPGDWVFRSEYVHSRGMAFKNPYGGNLDLDTELGDRADAWYALMIAPLVPETFHAKLRYDVYRDSGSWDRAYAAYDFGLDYHVSYNLIFSAVGTYVNDRRLAPGQHNYFMFDLQMGLRF